MEYIFKTPLPAQGCTILKSGGRHLGSTDLNSTVGQYSGTEHTNTVRNQDCAERCTTVHSTLGSSTSSYWNIPLALSTSTTVLNSRTFSTHLIENLSPFMPSHEQILAIH